MLQPRKTELTVSYRGIAVARLAHLFRGTVASLLVSVFRKARMPSRMCNMKSTKILFPRKTVDPVSVVADTISRSGRLLTCCRRSRPMHPIGVYPHTRCRCRTTVTTSTSSTPRGQDGIARRSATPPSPPTSCPLSLHLYRRHRRRRSARRTPVAALVVGGVPGMRGESPVVGALKSPLMGFWMPTVLSWRGMAKEVRAAAQRSFMRVFPIFFLLSRCSCFLCAACWALSKINNLVYMLPTMHEALRQCR